MTGSGEPPQLIVCALGALSISDGVRSWGPGDLGGPRPKQVLEILLSTRGRLVPTDRIANLLWGDDLPENPAGAIQTFVSTLRRNLTGDRQLARRLVVTEREAYRFATELVDFDLDRFDELLERSAREPTQPARRMLEEALSLVRGEILEDEPYATYLLDLRASYQGRILGVHLDAADAALAERDLAAGLGHAEAALTIDPFSERGRRIEMLALYATGRVHEALARYRSFRTELDTELGLDPSADSRKLEAALIRQDDVESLLPRAIRRQRQEHRGPTPRLLGRSGEMEALTMAIDEALGGRLTLIRVQGGPGTGKSRLLDEVERRMADARIGRAGCSRVEQHLSYVPLASALRTALTDIDLTSVATGPLQAVFPELSLTNGQQPFDELETLESVVALLAAHAPIVLLIDDIHLADGETVAALSYLQRRAATHPVAIIFTTCERGECTRHVEAEVVVHLETLTSEDLAPLNVPGLFDLTGGNPRFIAETLASESRARPSPSLAEALRAQCAAEGRQAHRLLSAAAVLGQPFTADVVSHALDIPMLDVIDELERLCQRRLLKIEGVGFRFRYDLVRQVLASDVSPARRQLILEASGKPAATGAPAEGFA